MNSFQAFTLREQDTSVIGQRNHYFRRFIRRHCSNQKPTQLTLKTL